MCFDGIYFSDANNLCHTTKEVHPHVTVDLEAVFHVRTIVVINREDFG